MSQPLSFRKEPDQEIFPEELLRRYRSRAGLSQDELAAQVGLSGGRMIQSWEGGFSLPKPVRLRNLLEIFYTRNAFVPGKELEEAGKLWASVQKFFEANSEKLSAYPHFDSNWFETQVIKKPSNISLTPFSQVAPLTNPASVPLTPPVPLPVKPLPVTPVSTGSIIGRDNEVSEVAGLLMANKARLVTLTGPGGSGKTRLALEAIARLNMTEYFKDGIFFAALETINSPGLLAPQLATALNIIQPDSILPLEVVKAFLSNRQILLVLDNFEQLLPAASIITELLQAAPGLQIMITSREPLRIKNEREYRVAPLSLPVFSTEKINLEELGANPAMAFFNQRAALANPDFKFNLSNAEAVAKICQKLDGLPLAIELAAGRANLLSPAQILVRLDNRFKLLASSSPAYSSRHRTLHGALEWSYDLLEPAEKRLFARLAVFAGSFCVEAAESICGEDTLEVLDGLDSLINKNLLQRVKNVDGPVRCQLLQTIRDFALEKLAGTGSEEEAHLQGRNAGYYLELVETSERHFRDSEQVSVFDTLEQEYPNIRQVIRQSLSGENPEVALRICGAMWYFWWIRGYVGEGRSNLEKVVALPIENKAARAKALNALGNLTEIQGDLDLSLTYFAEGLDLYRELDDKRGMGNTSNNLGNVSSVKGDFQAAKHYLELSLEYRKQAKDRHAIAASLTNLGRIARLMGDLTTCLAYYKEALAVFRQLKDPGTIAQLLSNLANLTLNTGDLDEAKEYARESIFLTEQTHNKAMHIHSLITLGQINLETGELEPASNYYQQALDLGQQLEDPIAKGNSLDGLGRVFIEINRFEDAARCFDKSLELFEAVGARQNIVMLLLSQATLAGRQENLIKATALLEKSEKLQTEWNISLDPLDQRTRQRLKERLVVS